MILALRTDKPEAEIYLLKPNGEVIEELVWQAHRELSNTIFHKLDELMALQKVSFGDLQGIVIYKGPGSFTGLRIGATVANTLAYSLDVSVVGANGDRWQQAACKRLANDENDTVVLPEYGGEANITKPRK